MTAYETLVARYQRPLISFSFRIVGDIHAAEEIAQDTLFAVYRTIDRIDLSKKFSTYLFAIAKNTAISFLRRKKYTVSLDEVEIAIDEELYEVVAQKERAELVQQTLEMLPEKYKQIISLYYFEDLPYGELAKKLHVPINTVRTHLRRAKDRFKQLLAYEHIT